MSTQMIYTAIGLWLLIVAAAVGFAVFSGVPMTIGTSVLALLAALVPPAILLKLCWGVEPQTAAQMIKGRP